MTASPSYGLMAAPSVRWLISSEPDVREAVKRFIAGMDEPIVDVAGPPNRADLRWHRQKPEHRPLRMPTVRLRLAMVKHHLTGESGVSVTCSDADMDEIARWHRLARQKRLSRALAA